MYDDISYIIFELFDPSYLAVPNGNLVLSEMDYMVSNFDIVMIAYLYSKLIIEGHINRVKYVINNTKNKYNIIIL